MYLVVGGAGFIGSNIVNGLSNNSQNDVVVCDSLGDGGSKWKNLRNQTLNDIIRPDWLEIWLEQNIHKLDTIICTAASDAPANPDKNLLIHYHLPRTLWEKATIHKKKFIYFSSWETYGDGRFGFQDKDSLEFLSSLKPLNSRAWAQHNFDMFAMKNHSLNNAPEQWIGLKLFDVYGPNEYHKNNEVSDVLKIFNQLRKEGEVKLPRSTRHDLDHGEYIRDRLWIGDCVSVVNWIISRPNVSGIFNLGSGHRQSFNQLANIIANAIDIPLHVSYVHLDNFNKNAPIFNQAHNQKLIRETDFPHSFNNLQDGINLYIYNYLMASSMFV